jgi:hypothetical protein
MATIRNFPSSKKLSGSNLREFRNYVSQLKKQGVLPAKVKTGSARPYFKIQGRTLANYVNKNHRRLTPYAPPSKPTLTQGPLFIRDFATDQKSLAVLFRDIEHNRELAAQIDAKKRPGERWAMRIDGTDSLNIYADIELMIDDLFKYGPNGQPYGSHDIYHDRAKSRKLLPKLQLIRWNKGIGEWSKTRKFPKHKSSHAGRQAKRRRK